MSATESAREDVANAAAILALNAPLTADSNAADAMRAALSRLTSALAKMDGAV